MQGWQKKCVHCGKETSESAVVLVIDIFQFSCFNFQLLLLPLSLSVCLTQSLGCPHGEPQWPWGTGQELHAFGATFTWSADNQVMLEAEICWNPRDSFMKAFQSRRLLYRALVWITPHYHAQIFDINLPTRLTVLNHPSCLNKLLPGQDGRMSPISAWKHMKTTHTYPYHVFQTNLLGSSCRSVVPRSPGHVLSLGTGRTTRMRAKRPKACGTGPSHVENHPTWYLISEDFMESWPQPLFWVFSDNISQRCTYMTDFSWNLLSLAKGGGLRGAVLIIQLTRNLTFVCSRCSACRAISVSHNFSSKPFASVEKTWDVSCHGWVPIPSMYGFYYLHFSETSTKRR